MHILTFEDDDTLPGRTVYAYTAMIYDQIGSFSVQSGAL